MDTFLRKTRLSPLRINQQESEDTARRLSNSIRLLGSQIKGFYTDMDMVRLTMPRAAAWVDSGGLCTVVPSEAIKRAFLWWFLNFQTFLYGYPQVFCFSF